MSQFGTRIIEITTRGGNGTGVEDAQDDLKKVHWGTNSVTEKSRGTESKTEKSRQRESAKCDMGYRAKQGFFQMSTGMKRPNNVHNGREEMAKKKRRQLSETSLQVE